MSKQPRQLKNKPEFKNLKHYIADNKNPQRENKKANRDKQTKKKKKKKKKKKDNIIKDIRNLLKLIKEL